MIDTSKLSDTELNRAMIWLYPIKGEKVYFSTAVNMYTSRKGCLDYLSLWNLTMPLAVEHNLSIDFFYGDTCADQARLDIHCRDKENPLRAICCVLVQIAMEGK